MPCAQPTWRRYELGQSPPPVDLWERLLALEGAGRRSVGERIRDVVYGSSEVTWSELRARVPQQGMEEAARQLIADGEIVELLSDHTDRLGRHKSIRVLSPPGRPAPPESHPMDASELRARLDWLGMTVRELAAVIEKNQFTVRNYLNRRRPIPLHLVGQLRSVTNPEVTADEMRKAYRQAGWTRVYVAQRYFGRHHSQVAHWENGDRKIPRALQNVAWRVVRDAALAVEQEERLEKAIARIVEYVDEHPRVTRKMLLHTMRAKAKRGVQVSKPMAEKALRMAIDRGLIEESEGHTVDRRGRPTRRQFRLYPPGGSPNTPEPMTGSELHARRLRVGLTRAELGPECGVTVAAVLLAERRQDRPIPLYWAEQAEKALAARPPQLPRRRTSRPGRSVLARRNQESIRVELLTTAAGRPGIPRYRLFSAVGEGRDVKAALKDCLRSGELATAPTLDTRGRPYPGYYLPAAVPPPRDPGMTADELRLLREAAGLTKAELAARIGVGHQAISKYESGERRIDARREVALRDGCGRPPAPKSAATAVEQILARIDRHPGGALRTDLLYLLKAHGENVLDEPLAAGVVHWADTFDPDKNGRPQPRRRLRRGPQPATIPPAGLTAQHFRLLLQATGRSQSSFARQLGISQVTVNRWAAEGVPPARRDQVLAASQ